MDHGVARYREALALADRLGVRSLAARWRLGLGALLARARHVEPARTELAADAALRAVGMSFWLPEAVAGLRAVPARGGAGVAPGP